MRTVKQIFERALEEIPTRVFALTHPVIAVAYSGGLDSSVLLHLASQYAQEQGIALYAFHIHHGLSPHADHWLDHAQQQCAQWGVSFDYRHVKLNGQGNVEESARLARYQALGALCHTHQVSCLLVAHHQDDQIETVCLQWLRGAGVAGLSGMEALCAAPDLLGSADIVLARPLLDVPRIRLLTYAQERGISFVEDESNQDTRYARNALRHQVLPVLKQYFPEFQVCMARSAGHLHSAQQLLNEVAEQDISRFLEEDALNVEALRTLSAERINNLLRYWLSQQGTRMPSTARLEQIKKQAVYARDNAQVSIHHDTVTISRYRNKLIVRPRAEQVEQIVEPYDFVWEGQSVFPINEYGGVLHFEQSTVGVDAEWLRQQNLSLRLRQGRERLKCASDRPTRTLKQYYQERGIPFWERGQLPLLYAGDQLLHAAKVGTSCRCLSESVGMKIQIRWEATV